jgi:hypothetical protein
VINHFLALPVDRAIVAREALGIPNEYVESLIDRRPWAQGKKKPKRKGKKKPKGKTVKWRDRPYGRAESERRRKDKGGRWYRAKELIRTRRKKKKK